MPVTFDQLAGWPVYRGTHNELQATWKGLIAWADINLHYIEYFPANALPKKLVGSNTLYAESVQYEPQLGENDIINCATSPATYTTAVVTLEFKTIPYTSETGGGGSTGNTHIVTRRKAIGGEFMTQPKVGLRWVVGQLPVKNEDVSAGKIIPMIDHVIEFHREPYANLAAFFVKVRNLVGKINDGSFEGAATGTMLFLGAEIEQVVTSDETSPYNIQMHFQERIVKQGSQEVGWNHFFHPELGEWRELESITGAPIYASGDFDTLF